MFCFSILGIVSFLYLAVAFFVLPQVFLFCRGFSFHWLEFSLFSRRFLYSAVAFFILPWVFFILPWDFFILPLFSLFYRDEYSLFRREFSLFCRRFIYSAVSFLYFAVVFFILTWWVFFILPWLFFILASLSLFGRYFVYVAVTLITLPWFYFPRCDSYRPPYLTDCLNKVRTKLKSTWLAIFTAVLLSLWKDIEFKT